MNHPDECSAKMKMNGLSPWSCDGSDALMVRWSKDSGSLDSSERVNVKEAILHITSPLESRISRSIAGDDDLNGNVNVNESSGNDAIDCRWQADIMSSSPFSTIGHHRHGTPPTALGIHRSKELPPPPQASANAETALTLTGVHLDHLNHDNDHNDHNDHTDFTESTDVDDLSEPTLASAINYQYDRRKSPFASLALSRKDMMPNAPIREPSMSVHTTVMLHDDDDMTEVTLPPSIDYSRMSNRFKEMRGCTPSDIMPRTPSRRALFDEELEEKYLSEQPQHQQSRPSHHLARQNSSSRRCQQTSPPTITSSGNTSTNTSSHSASQNSPTTIMEAGQIGNAIERHSSRSATKRSKSSKSSKSLYSTKTAPLDRTPESVIRTQEDVKTATSRKKSSRTRSKERHPIIRSVSCDGQPRARSGSADRGGRSTPAKSKSRRRKPRDAAVAAVSQLDSPTSDPPGQIQRSSSSKFTFQGGKIIMKPTAQNEEFPIKAAPAPRVNANSQQSSQAKLEAHISASAYSQRKLFPKTMSLRSLGTASITKVDRSPLVSTSNHQPSSFSTDICRPRSNSREQAKKQSQQTLKGQQRNLFSKTMSLRSLGTSTKADRPPLVSTSNHQPSSFSTDICRPRNSREHPKRSQQIPNATPFLPPSNLPRHMGPTSLSCRTFMYARKESSRSLQPECYMNRPGEAKDVCELNTYLENQMSARSLISKAGTKATSVCDTISTTEEPSAKKQPVKPSSVRSIAPSTIKEAEPKRSASSSKTKKSKKSSKKSSSDDTERSTTKPSSKWDGLRHGLGFIRESRKRSKKERAVAREVSNIQSLRAGSKERAGIHASGGAGDGSSSGRSRWKSLKPKKKAKSKATKKVKKDGGGSDDGVAAQPIKIVPIQASVKLVNDQSAHDSIPQLDDFSLMSEDGPSDLSFDLSTVVF